MVIFGIQITSIGDPINLKASDDWKKIATIDRVPSCHTLCSGSPDRAAITTTHTHHPSLALLWEAELEHWGP